MLKFCHLKIVSGTVDARKWSVKWRNWNISDIFFSPSSIEWFSRFKEDRYDISDTPRSGRPSGFDEDILNTLIHNDPRQCTRELTNVMNCDHYTIVRLLH